EKTAGAEILVESQTAFAVLNARRAVVPLGSTLKQHVNRALTTLKSQPLAAKGRQRLVLRLQDVDLGVVQATGFDIHVTNQPNKATFSRSDSSFVGSISLFRHFIRPAAEAMPAEHPNPQNMSESFDISHAIA